MFKEKLAKLNTNTSLYVKSSVLAAGALTLDYLTPWFPIYQSGLQIAELAGLIGIVYSAHKTKQQFLKEFPQTPEELLAKTETKL